MGKDTPITELPGIAPSAVVQLNRIGIVTTGDLLSADYEQLAVLLDCFHDADRLIAEARRLAGADSAPAPAPAKKPARTGTAKAGARAAREAPADPAPASAAPAAPAQSTAPAPVSAAPAGLAGALVLTARALEGEPDRAALMRRLNAVTRLLHQGGGDDEAACALVVEMVESGAMSAEEAGDLGARIGALVDECVTLRAVPVSPSGRPPRMYMEMAAKASPGSRRVCAALQLSQGPGEGNGSAPWYGRLLAEVLAAGGEDALVNELRARESGRLAA